MVNPVEKRIQFLNRFQGFLHNIEYSQLKSPRVFGLITGWILTANFLLFSLDQQSGWIILWLFINAYFWKKLNEVILTTIKSLMEILILLMLVFISLDVYFLTYVIDSLSNVLFISFHG